MVGVAVDTGVGLTTAVAVRVGFAVDTRVGLGTGVGKDAGAAIVSGVGDEAGVGWSVAVLWVVAVESAGWVVSCVFADSGGELVVISVELRVGVPEGTSAGCQGQGR